MQTALAENILGTEAVTETLAPIAQAKEAIVEEVSATSESAYPVPAAELVPYQHDPEVQRLPDIDRAMMNDMIRRLRGSDAMLAADLSFIARSAAAEADARGLAVEILAAARTPLFEPYVVQLILELLESTDEDVRFAATAAASDVSISRRVAFARPMRQLVSDAEQSPDIRRAAAAFLRAQQTQG